MMRNMAVSEPRSLSCQSNMLPFRNITASELLRSYSQSGRLLDTSFSSLDKKWNQNMVIHRSTKAIVLDGGEVCTVCLEETQEGEEVMTVTCSHTFHTDCLLRWVASKEKRRTCPVCRSDMIYSTVAIRRRHEPAVVPNVED